MKNLIRQILKEEVEQVSLSEILAKLKKIYPKLDYCVSEDGNKLKIWAYYMSSFEDMGADPDHPEEFTESGIWVEGNDSGSYNIGTFNDFRDNDGTYYDSDIDTFTLPDILSYRKDYSLLGPPQAQSILKDIVSVLDYVLDVEPRGFRIGANDAGSKPNYEGRPKGDPSYAFEWRKC